VNSDVVVIGGGAAGVGAARRLAQSGLSTILLEASSRLGGRAWTHEVAGLNIDLGCGWFHSADRNAWVGIAQAAGIPIDRSPAQWGVQYRDLGFPPGEQADAGRAFATWLQQLEGSRLPSDCAADALDPNGEWNDYIRTIVGFISGAALEQLSIADYLAHAGRIGVAGRAQLADKCDSASGDSGGIDRSGRRRSHGSYARGGSPRAGGDTHGIHRGPGR